VRRMLESAPGGWGHALERRVDGGRPRRPRAS
jgi:hypothetical protein